MRRATGPSSSDVTETMRNLRRTPKRFKTAAAGLTEAQLRAAPTDGSWSLHELLAHLRGAADVQGGWIARMLADEGPTIRYASPRTGMKRTGYQQHEFFPFLREFARQRSSLVATLASLELDSWQRYATFTGTTPGWTQTIFDVARGVATHERAHDAQIEATATAFV